MTNIDNRKFHINYGDHSYCTLDYRLVGLYDEIIFNTYYERVGSKKILCRHKPINVITEFSPELAYSTICEKCRGLLHKHEFEESLTESYQVEDSRYASIIYCIETCSICSKRFLNNSRSIHTFHLEMSDEIRKKSIALIKEYIQNIDAPIETRTFGSGYVLELPVWVAGQLIDGKEGRARAWLQIIKERHQIQDEIFDEISGI